VILLSETVIPKVQNLKQGTALRFVRPNTGNRPLAVHLLGQYDLGGDFVAKCKQLYPFDINDYLLHLWQLPCLNQFFNVEHFPAAKIVKPEDQESPAA
jgi:hypothetical protein